MNQKILKYVLIKKDRKSTRKNISMIKMKYYIRIYIKSYFSDDYEILTKSVKNSVDLFEKNHLNIKLLNEVFKNIIFIEDNNYKTERTLERL
jgi:hypothetical protein